MNSTALAAYSIAGKTQSLLLRYVYINDVERA